MISHKKPKEFRSVQPWDKDIKPWYYRALAKLPKPERCPECGWRYCTCQLTIKESLYLDEMKK